MTACLSVLQKSVNQIIHACQQHRYDCRQSHCAYHSMDWRMGKKLIFFAHIVYFIAVCLHKTTAKISTFYQLKYDLFSIYFTLNCFFASLLFESDITTALVPHHCLVDSVEIRRTKDFHPLDNARAEHNKPPTGTITGWGLIIMKL